VSVPVFPLKGAAALFLRRQGLDRPRSRRLTRASLTRFAEDVGGVQLDSINVLERAHHLTLWSRFGPYDRKRFEKIAYRERALIEYWAHAACLVPTTHLREWRRAMVDYRMSHTGWARWLKKNGKLVAKVEEAVRASGPLGNSDFEHRRPPGSAAGWWSWKPATHALHYLWMSGRFAVHSRVHFQKRFDLFERLMPSIATIEPPSPEEFQRWRVERSLHAMGAATDTDLHMYFTFPRGPASRRRRALESLMDSGEVREIAIEGERARWLALARDLPELASASRARAPSTGTTLLSPFDSFLWHRARTSRLYGFDYRIEVYTPGHKRVHGYYSLPILHDGQLIGRLDAKNHREERRVEVRNVHFEEWFAKGLAPPRASWGTVDRDRAIAGVAESLWSLAAFLGADEIAIARATPRAFAPALRRAIAKSRATAPATENGKPGRTPVLEA
jgi:uncharacterized protein YcaQ